ncbi:MAG: Fe-S protein assembly co-chaperone HscB [Bryobacteraceae bacterium]
MSNCWNCGRATEPQTGGAPLFCPSCNALQPPPSDYYALFGLPPRLALSPDELQQSFYALSRVLHPDRFVRKSERERQYSLEASSVLNDAWRTLRNPVARAEYVLRRHGFDIGEQRSNNVPPELLEEVFELNMAIEEVRGGDDSARPQLEAARANFGAMLGGVDRELDALFRVWDETQRRDELAAIRALLNRRKYIQNLVSEVDALLAPAA